MQEEKFICYQCVLDEHVKAKIKNKGNYEQNCSYCQKRLKNINIEQLGEWIDSMFNVYYELAGYDYYGNARGDEATDIIQDELGVEYDIAADIYESMKDNFSIANYYYGDEIKYEDDSTFVPAQNRSGNYDTKWEEITRSLKHESRFFNKDAKAFLDELFKDIHAMHTNESGTAIKTYTPENVFYRARYFTEINEVEKVLSQPERYLGPPPPDSAKSGRMNALGVPVFYGALAPETAIAEIRPVVGSWVIVAQFRPLRALRILDLSSMNFVSSVKTSKFDHTQLQIREKIFFLKTLSHKLTFPVLNGANGNEYLMTQAVAEYLGLDEELDLDGISFSSTQVNKDDIDNTNIVLFNKSSKVKGAGSEEKVSEYNVSLYEYEEYDDDVYESLNPKIRKIIKKKHQNKFNSRYIVINESKLVLALDMENIIIKYVKGISFSVDDYPVSLEYNTESQHCYSKNDDEQEF
ncbi:RES family NAD+ phosphorylase [Pectobacterium parvum]|uniref:RES family NAD+ phosphorylase n=1 Tax=Pectobacterium parvum TaxID=2778550 RepID=UPI001E336A61|nr:RES family NAD+ phosphorylase [Pectobacterium parvum]UFK37541.1 RES family NAD+ phosphorylase [Pectobacterium parvum]